MSGGHERVRGFARGATGLLAGVVWGFFVAFNVVFSDVFGLGEMAGAVAFVYIAYTALGFLFGLAGPRTGIRWAWWLAAPGVVFVLPGLLDTPGRALYHAAVIAAVAGGTAGGAWAGAHLRARRATP